ncbi:MAG TPA: histidine-type phosphatase [Reyranella sp.]|nr:histidine-type phosphatase [Reyranella sp.]
MRLALLLCAAMAWAAPAAAQDFQLERVILLSRHGVRAPTQPIDELDRIAATPWPRWPVAPGELTPRGAELMRLMGEYYRALYAGRGVIPAGERCPASGAVSAWADVSQRTRVSAQALLDGLYPRCGLKARHQADIARPDPLFHPPRNNPSCPFDQAEAKAAITARLGDFPSMRRDYAAPLALTQATLCPPNLAAGKDCGLHTEPAELADSRDGGVSMRGQIGTASTAVEIFQLEAAQGMPREQVAWGRLKDVELVELMSLHVLQFDLMQRTRYVARRQGSRLLATILAALQDGQAFPGAERGAQPTRFALLVGHDTNIANVAGLLELGWAIPGMQPDDPSPGGALAFELLRDLHSGQRYVGVIFHGQTLEQMREGIRLDLDRPAGRSVVQLPGCKAQAHGALCPLPRFLEIAQAAVVPACAR